MFLTPYRGVFIAQISPGSVEQDFVCIPENRAKNFNIQDISLLKLKAIFDPKNNELIPIEPLSFYVKKEKDETRALVSYSQFELIGETYLGYVPEELKCVFESPERVGYTSKIPKRIVTAIIQEQKLRWMYI